MWLIWTLGAAVISFLAIVGLAVRQENRDDREAGL